MGDNHAMTVKFINHRTLSKDGEVMMITLSQKGPSENSKWDFANPGRPLNPYVPSFNAIGVRGSPMKRILWKGRMAEICVQFAVIFGPFLQAGSDCV